MFYNYILEIKHASRVHGICCYPLGKLHSTYNAISPIVYFVLFISTFCTLCAVPNMKVFCRSPISYFPGMLLRYFVNNFEMVTVAPVSRDITFTFTFHMRCIITIIIIMIIIKLLLLILLLR